MEKAVRVCVSRDRTERMTNVLPQDHTSAIVCEAFKEAVDGGFDNVLFLNQRGEVTEGAISNVFMEKDGKWLTPPVDCGLLAGVYRRHLLETRAGIEERVLTEEDLRRADAVFLANAVRGLRRAEIFWEGEERMPAGERGIENKTIEDLSSLVWAAGWN